MIDNHIISQRYEIDKPAKKKKPFFSKIT